MIEKPSQIKLQCYGLVKFSAIDIKVFSSQIINTFLSIINVCHIPQQ